MAFSSSNMVARNPAPPTVALRALSKTRVVGSSWPWKSLSPMTPSDLTDRLLAMIGSSTLPWLCCGTGMRSRNASVGAMSIDRTCGVPRTIPSPPAMNVERMLTLSAVSCTSGT